MRLAVLSDIHGNHAALECCLDDALNRNVDAFLFLGDYLGEFPYPQKTMKILYSLAEKYSCFFLRGNKEDYWINRRNNQSFAWKEGTSSTGALQYCYANLTDRDLDFFASLPISREIQFEGCELLLVCHGSPERNNEKMLPDDERTKSILTRCTQKYILCGHTHIQQVMTQEGKTLLNPGAVGVSLHSAGNAQYMILHAKEGGWQQEFIEIRYNKEFVLSEIQESGLGKLAPCWTQVTVHLMMTGEISHGTVLAKAMEYCQAETGACTWYDIPETYWERAVRELIG